MLLLSLPEVSRTTPCRLFTASLWLDIMDPPAHESSAPTPVMRVRPADVRIERFPSAPTTTVVDAAVPPLDVFRHGLSDLSLKEADDTPTGSTTTTRRNCPQHHLLVGQSEQSPFNSNGHQRRKKVAFDKVHIREHSITVGDHGWRQEGRPPIQLDWPHSLVTRSISIEDWEGQRQRQGRAPPGHLPRMDLFDRQRRLRNVAGIHHEELLLMEREFIAARYVEWHRAKLQALYQSSPTSSTSTCTSTSSGMCCGGV